MRELLQQLLTAWVICAIVIAASAPIWLLGILFWWLLK